MDTRRTSTAGATRRAVGLVLVLAVIGSLAWATPSLAQTQEYPPSPDGPSGVSLSCSPSVLTVGELLSCTASGFAPGADVAFQINPPLGNATANAAGQASLSVALPELAPGTYSVTATGLAGEGEATATTTATTRIEVVEVRGIAADVDVPESGDPATTGLPVTGSSSTVPIAVVAAVLLAAGAVLLLGVRRARHTHT